MHIFKPWTHFACTIINREQWTNNKFSPFFFFYQRLTLKIPFRKLQVTTAGMASSEDMSSVFVTMSPTSLATTVTRCRPCQTNTACASLTVLWTAWYQPGQLGQTAHRPVAWVRRHTVFTWRHAALIQRCLEKNIGKASCLFSRNVSTVSVVNEILLISVLHQLTNCCIVLQRLRACSQLAKTWVLSSYFAWIPGTMTRSREVVRDYEYGGRHCPELEQTDVCMLRDCADLEWKSSLVSVLTQHNYYNAWLITILSQHV